VSTPATASNPDKPLRRSLTVLGKILKWAFYLFGGVIGIVIIASVFGEWTIQIVWYLAFGWIHFLVQNLASMQFNLALLAEGLACALALGVGTHYFCGWLYREAGASKEAPASTGRTWRWQWTACGLALLLLLFVAGIGTIGAIHQAAWLFNASEPLVVNSWSGRSRVAEAFLTASSARTAVAEYYENRGRLPQSSEDAGYSYDASSGSRLVSALEIREKGVVVATLHKDRDWPDGGEIKLTPAEDSAAKALSWKCRSTLPPSVLPATCRE